MYKQSRKFIYIIGFNIVYDQTFDLKQVIMKFNKFQR